MRGHLFVVLSLGLLLLCSAFALAQSNVVVTTLDNEITLSDEATFNVKITNNDRAEQVYTLYGLDVLWDILPEHRQFTLSPRESRDVFVRVKPLGPFKPSSYSLKLFIDTSRPGSNLPTGRYDRELPVILYPDEPADYVPSLRVNVEMGQEVNPQEPYSLKLSLENKNPLNLSNLAVRIQSDLPEFAQETVVSIPPLGSKVVEFTVTPNPFQSPKEYTLFFVFEKSGQVVKIIERKIQILPIRQDFSVEKVEEEVLLKTFAQLTVTNGGNVADTQKIKILVSLLDALFTTGDADIVEENGQRYLAWDLSLDAGNSVVINYIVNYRILAYLLGVLVLFGLFYFIVRSSVQISKTATTVTSGEDGTLSEIKITLEVRNISKKPLKDVIITDLVPGIANVERGLELGTLKPIEVKHTKKGTKVIWSLAELDGHEHRLITYKIKAKLNILGTFSLPRATGEYALRGKRRRKGYSNVFRISTE